jgi:hypothetical protein
MRVDAYRVGFRLAGIAPDDDTAFTPAARKAFWKQAGKVAITVKQSSLARRLDRHGNLMTPISIPTAIARDADVNPVTGRTPYSTYGRASSTNAPLQATGKLSRTQTLMRAIPEAGGVWIYWMRDRETGRMWGEILRRHARGFLQRFVYPSSGVGYVPPRDVIGLSEEDQAAVEQRMDQWWRANRTRFAAKMGGQPARDDSFIGIKLPVASQAHPTTHKRPARMDQPKESVVVRSVVEVRAEGIMGGTYGPGTQVSAKTYNAGYAFLKGTPAYKPFVPKPPTPPAPATPTSNPAMRGLFFGIPFHQRLPDRVRDALPDSLRWARTWRHLAGSKEGRDWWELVGRSLWRDAG